ncbi:hypothetical protein [Rahnella sp. PCH160]|uniref:hypothetical protein n=1 Tax=Rahnella sp. PCH160 TaxID=3447928 RepID=UPI0039FD693E
MSKSDSDFINVNQPYELKDWLTRNEFAASDDNVEKLKDIILKKLKDNDSAKNVRWSELDAALKDHPSLFDGLDPIKHQ